MPAMNVRQLIREEEPNYKNNIKYNITWLPNIYQHDRVFLGLRTGRQVGLDRSTRCM